MPPHLKPSQREGAKPKKPSAFKSKPKPDKGAVKVNLSNGSSIVFKGMDHEKLKSSAGVTVVEALQPRKAPKGTPAGQTKGSLILAMLKTPSGATSKEIEAATGWQPHSVRGYLGTLRKSGVVVISKKLPKEPTIYRVAAEKSSDEVL